MKLLSVFAIMLALFLPCAADAFTLVPRAMACMLYFRSDAVFIGQVLSTQTNKDSDGDWEGWAYTLKVIKSYRGADAPTMMVYTSNDSGRLPLDDGKRYLLFAFTNEGRLTIGYDQVSGKLKDSKQALKDLDTIMAHKAGQGGDIFGRVVGGAFNDSSGGLNGIHVSIKGPGGDTEVVTNKKGWFRVHVPAGTYSATASDLKWKFESQDIAWEDSNSFSVPDGGCAEIQIRAKPSSATPTK
jgi:hypothetical protein